MDWTTEGQEEALGSTFQAPSSLRGEGEGRWREEKPLYPRLKASRVGAGGESEGFQDSREWGRVEEGGPGTLRKD